jgi:hypothetical protein
MDATGAACDPWHPELQARYAMAPAPATASVGDPATALSLGLVAFDDLLRSADVTVAGSGTPLAAESLGACLLDEPWGWGDPDRPWRPCGGHLPLRAAEGDLRVDGGSGQGMLVVDGDLELTGGARYHGLLVVRGVLRVESGSTFEGMVLAGGGVSLGGGATLRGSACWAVRALDAYRESWGRWVRIADPARIGPL